MDVACSGTDRINCYALVAYIPGPLGKFLDDLRRELVPGYEPNAHVTLMPPRRIAGMPSEAMRQIGDYLSVVPPFDLVSGAVAMFPKTDVIYIEICSGRRMLEDLHRGLNQGVLAFEEPFPYHPHITLAQELPPERVAGVLDVARRRWAAFTEDRSFRVNELTFVQGSECKRWHDLATVRLHEQPLLVRQRK